MFLVLEVCSNVDLLKTIYFIKTFLTVIYLLAPILLLIKLMLELFNGLISSENVNWSILANKILTIISLFLILPIMNVVMNLVGNTSYSSCLEDATISNIKDLKSQQTVLDKLSENLANQISTVVDSAKVKASYISNSTNEGSKIGKRYNLSDSELTQIARLCKCEQGSAEGAKAEASLIANRYELFGKNYKSIYSYAKKSGWWACAKKMNNSKYDNSEVKAAVREALVLGDRNLDYWVDEHDCWNCNKNEYCSNGKQGDICSVKNNGVAISKVSDRSSYIENVSVIVNVHGATYTFSKFPTSKSDPFGYTKNAKNKYNELANK